MDPPDEMLTQEEASRMYRHMFEMVGAVKALMMVVEMRSEPETETTE